MVAELWFELVLLLKVGETFYKQHLIWVKIGKTLVKRHVLLLHPLALFLWWL